MKYRKERLNELIKEELGKFSLKELDFENSIVTIMSVEVSDDLLNAKVKINIMPSSKLNEISDILRKNRRRLEHFLMKKISIKQIPKLSFEINEHPEREEEVEKIFIKDKI